MKKRLLKGILAGSLLCMASCSSLEDNFEMSTATGHINLSVDLNTDVSSSASSRAEYTDVTKSMLSVRLYSADGSYDHTWPLAEFPAGNDFRVGDYTLEAFYGDPADEGFEKAYFYGKQTLKVTENNTTPVSVTASMAKAMVSVSYTEEFVNYFTSYSAEVLSAANNTTAFVSGETRAAYVAPGEVKLFVDVTKPNGQSGRFQPATFTALARHHYRMTFDIAGGASAPTLVVTFDDQLATEDVTIDLDDNMMATASPVVTPVGFTSDTEIRVTEGVAYSGELKLNILAKGVISQINMTTSSSDLTSLGWPASIDLGAATSSQQSVLNSLGLSALGVFTPNKSEMAVIDLSGVMEHFKYTEGATNENSISIYVKDRNGKVSEPVILKVAVDKFEIALSNAVYITGSPTMSVDLACSAPDITNLKLQYYNDLGTWSDLVYTIDTNAALFSRAATTYHLTVNMPAGVAVPFKIRALYGNSSASSPIEVMEVSRKLSVTVNAVDVWANHATVNVKSGLPSTSDDAMAQEARYMVSADGGSFTQATATANGSAVTLTGLQPGTSYTLVAIVDDSSTGSSESVSFTTEAATQLPNTGMESWCQTDSASNWELVYAGSDSSTQWGTNNPMTTSQGSNVAYCRISGTISTSDVYSGSAAALIRTVGWGSGNTATGSGGNSGKTKYIDAGLLHLGSNRTARPSTHSDQTGPISTDDLTCGIDFSSRPSSLSFWYKYSPKNSSDNGYVEIWVKDAAGNVLASKSQDLGSAGSYTQVTLPLSYPAGCGKAAKIYVKFLSTNSESFLVKSDANLSGPGFGNLSRGTFMGSQLSIDAIQLNY